MKQLNDYFNYKVKSQVNASFRNVIESVYVQASMATDLFIIDKNTL